MMVRWLAVAYQAVFACCIGHVLGKLAVAVWVLWARAYGYKV